MRYDGEVSEWKDDRGFGFIAPNGGGRRVFLHISSFSERNRRPSVGNLVSYELAVDERGRPQAKAALFVGERQRRRAHGRRPNGIGAVLTAILILGVVTNVAYVRLSHPNSTVSASDYKISVAREALQKNTQFRCSPAKSSCSQMTSCSEALFHQEQCGVVDMDGDGDGIPCERQWCN
jgi:cold shock CspA family protein